MIDARWTLIRSLFERACDLDANDQAAYLADACDDADVRREVESLLNAAARVGTRLEPHGSHRATPEGEPRKEGDTIGAWRLVRPLGQGGMGSVWLGERADGQFEMSVAIKLVKRGLDTDAVLSRFRRERQLLAGVEHPNVARLLDGGATEDGLPWLAMEYVDGAPIDAFCNERDLSIEDRLRLVAVVCDAVAAAHARGVVHRDLKPGNILVTNEGVPKLLDFGIAKLLEGDDELTGLTHAGEQPLTPRYASPEQLRGEAVTAATDVFALGVLLFELLTGESPHGPTATLQELEQAICHEDAPPPSRRTTRRVDGDVDVIVLTALQKETTRRYVDAAGLAADIRRHLEGLPIQARRDTLAYRVTKYVRRHRILIAATAGVVLVSIAAAAFSARAARIARDAEAAARAEKATSDELFQSVLDISTRSSLGFAEKVKDIAGTIQIRADLLEDVVQNVERLLELDPTNAEVRLQLVLILIRRAQIYGGGQTQGNVGRIDDAFADFARAAAIARELVAEGAKTSLSPRHALMNVLGRQGSALLRSRRIDEARAVAEEERALADAVLAEDPDDVYAFETAITARGHLARVASASGDHATAIAMLEENAARTAERLAASPDDPLLLQRAGGSRAMVGAALERCERYEDAAAAYGAAVDHLARAVLGRPESVSFASELAQARQARARSLHHAGAADASTEESREALWIYRRLANDEPENPVFRQRVGEVLLGLAQNQTRRTWNGAMAPAEALPYLEEAEAAFVEGLEILDALIAAGLVAPEPWIDANRETLAETRTALANARGELGE